MMFQATLLKPSQRRWRVTVIGMMAVVLWQAAAEGKPPNFLIILADDLGFSDVGSYGSEIATPRLDELAAGGLRYTQFYSTARCWPTRGALLTGYYAQQIGRDALPRLGLGGHRKRPSWARLLPTLLKPYGYRSFHSGKWHLDGTPQTEDFARSYVMDDWDRNLGPEKHSLDGKALPAVERNSGYYSTQAIAQHAIEFLQEHHRDYPDQPFFQYLSFLVPHFPLHAPQEDIDRYRGRYDIGWNQVRQRRWDRVRLELEIPGQLSALEPEICPPYHFPDAIRQLGAGEITRELPWQDLTKEAQRFQAMKMEIHAAMVDRMDREIGRVVDQLREMGEWENTVIFFLSDNGCSAEIMIRGEGHDPQATPGSAYTFYCLGPGWSSASNTPFRRHKVWVHEGGISSPLIVHWPAGITKGGEIRHTQGHVIDIAPTILELAGGSWPGDRDGDPVPPVAGRSLVKSFDRDCSSQHDFLWWEHEGHRALRKDQWKIVAAKGTAWELYDMSEDRAENHDRATIHPTIVEELEAIWSAKRDEFEQLASRAGNN